MPRIIFTSEFMKGAPKVALMNFVEYIATREGVEKLENAEKLSDIISRIEKHLPEIKQTFEYEDYIKSPTAENARELIDTAMERSLDNKKNFVEYMGKRPGAERKGEHGLWSMDDKPIDLKAVQNEVANHKGTLWRHVVSLRREDAERLGYNNADAWRSAVLNQIPTIVKSMKIPADDLRWYAAFHNTSHHPHIHLLVYSANPKHGFLTEQGIENMRSAFANEIFKQDLIQIYQEKTVRRDKLKNAAEERMHEISNMPHAYNPMLTLKLDQLAEFLKTYQGKAVYRYLPKDGKALVDDIFRELSRDPKIAEMYKSWCEMKDAVLSTYKDNLPEHGELINQKEFYPIKNIIIRESQRDRKQSAPELEPTDGSEDDVDTDGEIEDEYNIPMSPQTHDTPYVGAEHAPGGAVRLLHHLSRMIQNQYDNNQRKAQDHVESKLMKRIRQKQEALGQKME